MFLAMVILVMPDVQAHRMLETPAYYTGRQDALLMDDSQAVREALKRQVVKRGIMYGYQANMFDEGFGSACQALKYAREPARQRAEPEDNRPDVPIKR